MLKRLFNADKKLILRFLASFLLTGVLIAVFCGLRAYAASSDDGNTSQSAVTSDVSAPADGSSDSASGGSSGESSGLRPGDYTSDPASSVGTPG